MVSFQVWFYLVGKKKHFFRVLEPGIEPVPTCLPATDSAYWCSVQLQLRWHTGFVHESVQCVQVV